MSLLSYILFWQNKLLQVDTQILTACDHCIGDGQLTQPKMLHLPCMTKFCIFEPHEDYWRTCPYILITVSGEHPHPILLPHKTPPTIHAEIFCLLENIDKDLPDLTPHRILWHPIVKAYLCQCFPSAHQIPMLGDVHTSLSNQAHLGSYIDKAKAIHFPDSTGWEGELFICNVLIEMCMYIIMQGCYVWRKFKTSHFPWRHIIFEG